MRPEEADLLLINKDELDQALGKVLGLDLDVNGLMETNLAGRSIYVRARVASSPADLLHLRDGTRKEIASAIEERARREQGITGGRA